MNASKIPAYENAMLLMTCWHDFGVREGGETHPEARAL